MSIRANITTTYAVEQNLLPGNRKGTGSKEGASETHDGQDIKSRSESAQTTQTSRAFKTGSSNEPKDAFLKGTKSKASSDVTSSSTGEEPLDIMKPTAHQAAAHGIPPAKNKRESTEGQANHGSMRSADDGDKTSDVSPAKKNSEPKKGTYAVPQKPAAATSSPATSTSKAGPQGWASRAADWKNSRPEVAARDSEPEPSSQVPVHTERAYFVSTPPKIHLTTSQMDAEVKQTEGAAADSPSAAAPAESGASSGSRGAKSPGWELTGNGDVDMQKELTTALNFQRPAASSPSSGSAGAELTQHLQAEGVFGISAKGRNLGSADFIRQKQFEYQMDQKPFTTDDLLMETEKAIYSTLDSAQSSSVTKTLLQAAESVNAYRNSSLRAGEQPQSSADKPEAHADSRTAKPVRKE